VSRPNSKSKEELLAEIEELRERLRETEEVLRAIRRGEVDAIVLTQEQGDQVALILAPDLDQASMGASLSSSGTSQIFAKSIHVSDMDGFLRGSREMARKPTQQLYFGSSENGKRLRSMIESAAENNSTILLQGETGTGKSLIARWIYEHSRRANSAFVEINCASLRGDLLANELFGHIRGAFTSASENKQGLLDVVNGGTLFLDEIGDMDLSVQSQFLKVLEEKRYRRLGDTAERQTEFRLICATNRDLMDEIRDGRFRKDLFYRIHVFPIEIPPLRYRPEDIPGFANSILQSLGVSKIAIHDAAMHSLKEYGWPGNVRELRNVLERALLLSHNGPLKPQHFPGLQTALNTRELTESENERIQSAIDRFKGNKRKAAQFLGMSRVTLYRKLKKPVSG
jgi:two-component system, NtrC family, response regulator HydG